MRFQPLVQNDLEAARELWTTVPGLGLSQADEPGPLAAFLARNPGLSWGAFEGDRLVATVLAGHDGRRGFLYHLAVAGGFRGQGISAELIRRALDGLAGCFITKVHVFVLDENNVGLSFWAGAARHGWQRRSDILVFSRSL